MRNFLGAILFCGLMACATANHDRVVSDGVILPNSMCAKHGVAAASNDAPGSRMICELEELVGSHYPRCVCRDEQQIVADRAEAQQAVRDMEQHKCVSSGGGSCGN